MLTCPVCDGESQVKDSRPASILGGTSIRRRRVCLTCQYRWTTFEIVLQPKLWRKLDSVRAAAEEIKHAADKLLDVLKEENIVESKDVQS